MLVSKAPHLRNRSAVSFVDGRVTQEVLDLSELMSIHTVVGTSRPRSIKGWHYRTQRVNHAESGGVTTTLSTVVACHLMTSSASIPTPTLPTSIPRDLSSVLSDVVRRGYPRRPPHLRSVPPFEVVNLRPLGRKPVYHGCGWLPPKPPPNTNVLTPSVFVQGKQWALRSITTSEYLAVYDCPDRLVPVLTPLVFNSKFPGLHPGKSLITGAAAALLALSSQLVNGDNGGGVFPSFPSSVSSVSSGGGESEVSRPTCANSSTTSTSRATSTSTGGHKLPSTSTSSVGPVDTTTSRRCTLTSTSSKGDGDSKGSNVNANLADITRGIATSKRGLDSSLKPAPSYCFKRLRSTPPRELSDDHERILEQVDRDKRERKATKADDAEVPLYVWTQHYLEESTLQWDSQDKERIEKAMDVMRRWLLLRWKRRVFHSYLSWYYDEGKRSKGPSASRWVNSSTVKDQTKYAWTERGKMEYRMWHKKRVKQDPFEFEAGSDAVCRAWESSWWEWEDGSRPFHWRWPKWYRATIRDGLEVHLDGASPEYTTPQRDEKDPIIKEGIKKKLTKVRARRYIGKGTVISLTSFFAVPKGESDIRMVYDGTKSGLNASMWVPRFGLPTIETHLRSIEEGTYLADVDVGECFLNFPLHYSLRRLAGVDFTHYFPNPNGTRVWECWQRALMGCKSSPYQAVQGMTTAEEVIRGDPSDESNVFRWDRVRMNCPGDENYDSSKPWVSKVRKEGCIAADLVGYVDDLRTSGPNRKEAWHAARRTASMLNFLGIQDAARKRRDSTRTPGAWSGSVVVTRDDGVYVMSDSEKWDKAKGMISEVLDALKENPKSLSRKRLEEVRGFLNYVVRTYPSLKPYLTGLHLTIDGWRSNRDDEGWRIKDNRKCSKNKEEYDWQDDEWMWADSLKHEAPLTENLLPPQAPTQVEAKPRLIEDMIALKYLMANPKPLPRRVRSKMGKKVIYCFGDASSSGFGFTLEIDGKVYYEYGQWNESANDKSSNWREATNLLESLRRAVEDHKLDGLEIFIFTDNTTAESTFWKGWSKNKLLSEVVLEMRKLEMEYDLVMHIIHVSGSRMIRQGTDGLSRADHSNGVMNGERMICHVPLNLSAFDRSPQLLKRFSTSFKNLKLQLLEPRDWFDEHHTFGNFVWCPPPAAADAVVDLLNKARHKRPEALHIILVPRLMTGRWRRMLTRSSDFYFKIDWKGSWDLEVHHEPVLCFLCLPFSLSRPNLRDREQLLDDMGRLLLQPELQQKSERQKWNLLRKLLTRARTLCPLP